MLNLSLQECECESGEVPPPKLALIKGLLGNHITLPCHCCDPVWQREAALLELGNDDPPLPGH